jgi:hypothetical protein
MRAMVKKIGNMSRKEAGENVRKLNESWEAFGKVAKTIYMHNRHCILVAELLSFTIFRPNVNNWTDIFCKELLINYELSFCKGTGWPVAARKLNLFLNRSLLCL